MDIIQTYNPGNTNITEQELSAMKDLTDAQIAELAKAYPNQPTGNAYLVLWMKKESADAQRYPLSTWGNLNNLRRNGNIDILPYAFRKGHNASRNNQKVQAPAQRVVDLSKEETDHAEGMRPVIAPVKKEVVEVPSILSTDPELAAAQKELQEAKDAKAHHMTIKSLEAKVESFLGIK